MLTVDLNLARHLERAEAAANAAYVAARRRFQPETGARWIEVAGAYAMFDGPTSPLTQTFGLGMFDAFLEPEFAEVEEFFRALGADTSHEICAFAAEATTGLLRTRGYLPVEESLVLARPTTGTSGLQSPVSVRVIDSGEAALWAQTAARGWSSESAELARFVEDIGSVIAQSHGVTCFLAELEGQPIAAAALTFSEGIGLLAGASTIPSARNQGAQQSLLKARLDFAAVRGIELAMVVTHPESAARRNSERQGFRPAYTRSKWQLKTGKAQRER